MRRDLTMDVRGSEAEIEFVERYWTEVWQKHGDAVRSSSPISKKPEFRTMLPYLSDMPSGAKLLDGGCGVGSWTAHFTEMGYDVTGMDISKETIAQLSSVLPDLKFVVGDIRSTGLPDASFDGYFSWGTFEHFEVGLEPCIVEARRILKPGGLLCITVPFDNLRQALLASWRNGKGIDPRHRFYQWRLTKGELSEELQRFGFNVLEVRHIHKRQGVLRSLHHEFGMSYDWFATKALAAGLAPFVPGGLVAHMIMAVAQKPA